MLNDAEVSGRHAVVKWNGLDKCWQVGGGGNAAHEWWAWWVASSGHRSLRQLSGLFF